jgi:flagellar P-ring protein precursor FlgI
MNTARRTFTSLTRRALGCALAVFVVATVAPAARVKDLTLVEGGRDNQLVGYGLVVGLAGEGDSNALSTLRAISNTLQRYGLTIAATDIKSKNIAAVMITADIAAFMKPGARIDVTVASMGDAKTLQGGVLLQTPLIGADGRAYAVAQGPVAIGGFFGGAGGAGGATVQKNHPTVGTISNGAIVEREIPAQFVQDQKLRLLLHNPDFTSAARMADAINTRWPESRAMATDAATVQVGIPVEYRSRDVAFLADLGVVEVQPDTLARIVINERTGTIVATSTVRISHVAIAHGALTITVTNNQGVSQPGAFSNGTTQGVQSTQTAVNETKGGFTVLNEPPTVERLAAALNSLGVSTRDMMAIFQSLKRSGALQAELIIN